MINYYCLQVNIIEIDDVVIKSWLPLDQRKYGAEGGGGGGR